ncbi:uncharacterized protein LOC123915256 [Trifolium pratense]|uniref:Uncharacterized protein n=2 Tax=Trifolium pratense TaxID=57577 RepID=A0ACB0M325_TRIPR|nr:uncharacterized protein LOC123915256 [Trifolium pratense]CAJ2675003.1 unnamed protein product [Trifolium pratense]
MAETSLSLIVPNTKKKTPQFSSSSSVELFCRNTLFYDKLPSQPLRLSVLKLDGSSFDIQVSKTATIAELKDAVEAVFSYSPQHGPGKISWPHVWGQFCLCYDGMKLVTEEDHLRNYGVKDGDQLNFIRHVSNNCGVQRKRSKKRVFHMKQNRRCKSSQVSYCKQNENCDDDDNDIGSDEEALENAETKHQIEKLHVRKNKFTGFVGELLHTPLAVVRKTRTQNQIFPSTISKCLIGGLKKIRRIVSFGRRKQYPTRRQYQ